MGTNYARSQAQPAPDRMRHDPTDWSWMASHVSNELDVPTASMRLTPFAAPALMPTYRHFGLGTESAQTMDPTNIFNTQGFMAGDNAFGAGYDTSANLPNNSASFGSMTWPAAPKMSQDPHLVNGNYTPMFRNQSYSSTSSDSFIKPEEDLPVDAPPLFYESTSYSSPLDLSSTSCDMEETKPQVFSTDIDTLMRTIQTHEKTAEGRRCSQPTSSSSKTGSPPSKQKKRYVCTVPDCQKAFSQKTHLEIHTRAHTGAKPFSCSEPSCGQRFSQLGNLKTHQRRHTGERPYECDICHKRFAQHGNVRAHKNVHSPTKQFTCKLDDCQKTFSQLGNLKSHQNKFHVETIRRLKGRFQNIRPGDTVEAWEMEMWKYFGELYKNCNKGIKGRGKDRRIQASADSKSSPDIHEVAHQHQANAGVGSQRMVTLAEEVARRVG